VSKSNWTDDGLPVVSAADQSGMKDFYEAYEANYSVISAELLQAVERLPDLARILKGMSKEQLEEQDRVSRAQLRGALVDGKWEPLITNQRAQGTMYAGLNVRFREWFEVVADFQKLLVPHLVKAFAANPARLTAALVGMNRYLDIAMSVIGESYLDSKENRISQQQAAIKELSTPVLQVRDRMLLLPIIGVIDTHRARLLTETLLRAIRANRAKVVVVDVTGVAAVDSKVANHLLQTVAACRLMGASAIVTGLSAEVAQTLVTLGVELGKLNTVGDLQGGLEDAERMLGYHVVKAES
jgi:rsbT co-antagonist protein RsbR